MDRQISKRRRTWGTACGKTAPLLILWAAVLSLLWLATGAALAGAAEGDRSSLDFSVFKLGSGAPVVLVVGGIQGDEPGGFSAATLLAMRYTITRGTLWVVPNLNFPSIIKRSRGLHGDMNRKFAVLPPTDPEYPTVARIQELIRAPEVALVLNLHDGSGYYRPTREGPLHNPSRWGQSVIIDQDRMPEKTPLSGLRAVAERVLASVNKRLLAPGHRLHLHNTRTAEGDREMEKSLSWFAVRHGKAAFGLEASKEFPVEVRAYYHLRMVEAFLAQAGVHFERDFKLTQRGVLAALQSDLTVAFAGNRIFLPLEDARPRIAYLPLPKNGAAGAVPSKPIMAVLPDEDDLCVHYGNRMVTRIRPDWRELDDGLDGVGIVVDGRSEAVPFGRVVAVRDAFEVRPVPGYRVNAIGVDVGKPDESGIRLRKKDFQQRFSVDRRGTLYRVEVYRDEHFAGMFLVRFGTDAGSLMTRRDRLPATGGRESSLGW